MQNKTMDSVSFRLKHAREQTGRTLAELAQKTGYAQTTLSSVENGHDQPSKRLLEKWLGALSLNRRWVETGQGEMFTEATAAKPVVEPGLAAPLHFRIQAAKRHATAVLLELDHLERELSARAQPRKRKSD